MMHMTSWHLTTNCVTYIFNYHIFSVRSTVSTHKVLQFTQLALNNQKLLLLYQKGGN